MTFAPLQVDAILSGPVSFDRPIALDALLGFAIVDREGIAPAIREDAIVDLSPWLDRVLERSACGRLYLASAGVVSVEARELRYIHRRFPVDVAQQPTGREMRRLHLSAGPAKSYRIPYERMHLVGDCVTWWCVGERDGIADLLASITHLGRKRAVGNGRVASWSVEPCDAWADGFPVAHEGRPLRNLPADWPGLAPTTERQWATLMPPYWRRSAEVECCVPARPT